MTASQRTEQQAGAAQPVAWMDEWGNPFPLAAKQYSIVGKNWKPLFFAHPPAAEPKGMEPLTTERRKAIMESAINGKTEMGDMEYVAWIIEATERAHGIGGRP